MAKVQVVYLNMKWKVIIKVLVNDNVHLQAVPENMIHFKKISSLILVLLNELK